MSILAKMLRLWVFSATCTAAIIFLSLFIPLSRAAVPQTPMKRGVTISQVSFEHHRTALGIAETAPRISWRFEGDVLDWEQTDYEIEITRSGKSGNFPVKSSDSLYVPWPDAPLGEAESANVRVRANGGQSSTPWSDLVGVETGLVGGSWTGVLPITGDVGGRGTNEAKRPIYFRKDFKVVSPVESARLYITGLGIYEAEINGKRVGDHVLAPGWQSYNNRHVYDTYNVTELVQEGENAIGAIVGEGWYSGRLGWIAEQRNVFGNKIGLLSLLVITLKDGTKLKIPTDNTWKSSGGPIITSEIYNGELYDAAQAASIKGWSQANFSSASWNVTSTLPALKGKLASPDQPPIRRIEEIKPERIFKSPAGETLVDFGQNLAGWLRVKVDGPAGTTVVIRHAEVLEKNGEISTRPLRDAMARDTLILSGKGELVWEPKFTYHGFRFAQISGWPSSTPLNADTITAIVVHTDMEQTGWWESSNQLLNKFHSNVRWSMKGNFMSIPTDCPQRDERLGWTGDAHQFGPASNFFYNTAGFWKGWHRDIWSEMSNSGKMQPPHFVPNLPSEDNRPTAIWGDVVVGNPWNVFRWFGDLALLGEHLPQAQNWIDIGIPRNDAGLWNRDNFQYGDWLDPLAPPEDAHGATTHPVLVADAYLVYMTEIMSVIARSLSKSELAAKYEAQHSLLRERFHQAWVSQGALANHTQTAYALALAFDLLVDETEHENAISALRSIIAKNKYLVGTGFAGTPALGIALRKFGATEDFYKMLSQTSVPSWLYQVVQNATTTWERWDSLLADGSVNNGGMTSFNHYAFGSVADWMHTVIGGIAPAEPGWRKITFAPIPGGDVTSAKAKFLSPYGEVSSSWSVSSSGFHLEIHVPPNTKGYVVLPGATKDIVVGSGQHYFNDPNYQKPR